MQSRMWKYPDFAFRSSRHFPNGVNEQASEVFRRNFLEKRRRKRLCVSQTPSLARPLQTLLWFHGYAIEGAHLICVHQSKNIAPVSLTCKAPPPSPASSFHPLDVKFAKVWVLRLGKQHSVEARTWTLGVSAPAKKLVSARFKPLRLYLYTDGSVVDRRAWDQKVLGSSPGRSGKRTFFSRVHFLCWFFSLVSVPSPWYRSST